MVFNAEPDGNRIKPIKRKRASIEEMHEQLGTYYFRRSYRMTYAKFGQLIEVLSQHMSCSSGPRSPNGPIPCSIQLSAVIRYFSGGLPYNIMLSHGISQFFINWSSVDGG